MDTILFSIIGCGGLAGLVILLQKFLTGKKPAVVKAKHDVIQEQGTKKLIKNNKQIYKKLNEIKTLDDDSEKVVNDIKQIIKNTVNSVKKDQTTINVINSIESDWEDL